MGFHNDVQDFKADWAKVRAVAEDVGRDPETISRSAHLVVRTDGAEGLPIDPISFPIIQGGVDEHIGSASALALLPPSIGPDDRGRGIGQALMHTVLGAAEFRGREKAPIHARNRGSGMKLVPHTGFEPVISALRGRCPGPLDECGTGADEELIGLGGV